MGGTAESVSLRALCTTKTAGQVGQALGVIDQANDQGAKWGLMLDPQPTDLSSIPIEMAVVRRGFSPNLAAAASGQPSDSRKIVLIGAGALGSQVADVLFREGYGHWTIVDDDRLFPHNLARHALDAHFLGLNKAFALNLHLNLMSDGLENAASIPCNVLEPGEHSEALVAALADAELIIDASASVEVERWLAREAKRSAPAISVFFNPSGTDLVILSEGSCRNYPLDSLEMAYYRLLITSETLADHLAAPAEPVLQATGCREPSVAIPQSRVIRLVGLAAGEIRSLTMVDEPRVAVWHDAEGALTQSDACSPTLGCISAAVSGWTITVLPEVLEEIQEHRATSGSVETGGILTGSWDYTRNIIYVVGAIGPPPDSVRDRSGFIRGTAGLDTILKTLSDRTMGNISYVGEWHTHPPGSGSLPSTTDQEFLQKMRAQTRLEDAPALMLIGGEDGIRVALKTVAGEQANQLLPSP